MLSLVEAVELTAVGEVAEELAVEALDIWTGESRGFYAVSYRS